MIGGVLYVGSLLPGVAAELVCTCTTPFWNDASGEIVSINGEVLVSKRAGLEQTEIGEPVYPGTHIITGTGSTAEIEFGTCTIFAEQTTEVVFSHLGSNICTQVNSVAAPATDTPAGFAGVTAAGLSGALAIGGLLLGGGGTPASR